MLIGILIGSLIPYIKIRRYDFKGVEGFKTRLAYKLGNLILIQFFFGHLFGATMWYKKLFIDDYNNNFYIVAFYIYAWLGTIVYSYIYTTRARLQEAIEQFEKKQL